MPKSSTASMNRKDKAMYALYKGVIGGLSLLPLRALYGVGAVARVLLRHVVKYRREVIRRNLRACFPEKTEAQLREIEADFYRQFADNIVETIKLPRMSDRTVDRLVEVRNAELVNDLARQGRSIVLYLGHYGNWELVPAIVRQFTEPLICAQVYKPLRDAAFDRVMLEIRSRFNPVSLPQHNTVRQLIRWNRSNQPFICGFIADQRSNSQVSHGQMSFLGRPTHFVPGGEEVGRRIDAAYIYLDVEKPERHKYVLTFKPIEPEDLTIDSPYTRRYMEMLEQTIRRRPGLWLWSHRRWAF